MENKLPQEYKENIFQKIRNYIKKIFFKNDEKTLEITANENTINNLENVKNNGFMEHIKVDGTYKDTEYEKKKFMKKLNENPDLLDNFSTDRLEKILQYYLDENEKKRMELKKLTSN